MCISDWSSDVCSSDLHLGNLKAGEDEVREVYYHALLLGFVGQYYFETGDTGELGKLKELHARQLPVAPAPTHVLREEQITPQPYLSKDPPGPRYPRQWDKLLLKAGMVVALLDRKSTRLNSSH